jgi:hypothetical protein
MTTGDKPRDPRLRDPEIDAAWETLPRDEPPPALDAAIRTAARKAVGARPERVREATRPGRWWWPLAAAATIGAVTIGILQIGGEPGRDDPMRSEPAVVSDMAPSVARKPIPAPAGPTVEAPPNVTQPSTPAEPTPPAPPQAMPAPMTQVPIPQTSAPAAGTPAPVAAKPRDDAMRGVAPGPPTPVRKDAAATGTAEFAPSPPAPAPEAAARREAAATESRAQDVGRIERSARETAARANERPAASGGADPFPAAPAAPPPPATMPSAPGAEPSTPAPRLREPFPSGGDARSKGEPSATRPSRQAAGDSSAQSSGASRSTTEWIALIRRLRSEGRIEEAVRELAAFRAAHPDPRELPLDLRNWRPFEPE